MWIFTKIEVDMHQVRLGDDIVIKRPPQVSPEEWRDFWTEVKDLNG